MPQDEPNPMPHVLVVDDSRIAGEDIALSIRENIPCSGVTTATSLNQAEALLIKALSDRKPTVMVLDICMVPGDATRSLGFLEKIEDPQWVDDNFPRDHPRFWGRSALDSGFVAVVVYSSSASSDQILEFDQRGFGYFNKPEQRWEHMASLITNAVRRMDRKREIHALSQPADWRPPGLAIIGKDPKLISAYKALRDFANLPGNILIVGEPGTGKENAARAVHAWLNHPDKPPDLKRTQGQDLSSGTPDWALARLFGRAANSLRHGDPEQLGLFDRAGHGVLFIDEFQDMTTECQAILLSALDGNVRTFSRFNGLDSIPVTAKIVCAFNADYDKALREGTLRRDIDRRFREHGTVIRLPPLRERKEDIPDLARSFVNQESANFGEGAEATLTEAALSLLKTTPYHWPTNVSGLKSVVRNAVYKVYDRNRDRREYVVDVADISEALSEAPLFSGDWSTDASSANETSVVETSLKAYSQEQQRRGRSSLSPDQINSLTFAARCLREAGGNRTKAAQLFGVTRSHFQTHMVKRLKEAGLNPDTL